MNFLKKYPWLVIVLPLFTLYCKKSEKTSLQPPPAINDTLVRDTVPAPADTTIVIKDTVVELKDSIVAENLNFPWEILWGPDDHIWMTERGGTISRFNPATGTIIPLLTEKEVSAKGEGGMLGMVLHPNFSTNPHVFVVYNYMDGPRNREKVVRYTYNGSSLVDRFPVIQNIVSGITHTGSRLYISSDLKLFITLGESKNLTYSQDTSLPNGKILRLNLDGTIPADNPKPGNPYWSLGHRNPQGLVFANNKLYSSEHGPINNDELNIIEKGRNYGWPDVEGVCDLAAENVFCTAKNVVDPIMTWSPAIAACGLDYYDKDLIPQWKNSLLLVALKQSRLYQLKLDTSTFSSVTATHEFYVRKYGRMRDLCISSAGKVYICTSNGGNTDRIIEISKK